MTPQACSWTSCVRQLGIALSAMPLTEIILLGHKLEVYDCGTLTEEDLVGHDSGTCSLLCTSVQINLGPTLKQEVGNEGIV